MDARPRVITASRRTDVPAFYSEWLIRRLRAGFCHVRNPYNGAVSRVALTPADVAALALFTRDPGPLLAELPALLADGYVIYAHVSLNGYPPAFEPHAPAVARVLASVARLSGTLGPQQVVWRYDPVLLSDATPAGYHLTRFEELAAGLEGLTESCYLSFATFYRKTERRLGAVERREGFAVRRPAEDEQRALARALLEIAAARGITLHACAGAHLLDEGLERGSCADSALVTRLRPDLRLAQKAAPTRGGCGCCEATDVGAFDTCVYGCEYCYATQNQRLALRRRGEHDPGDTILWRPPSLRGVDLDAAADAAQLSLLGGDAA
jgi:hypothetical protein